MTGRRSVLQFKIQLHVAIQDAMGWFDCHLHVFRLGNPDARDALIGIPDPDRFEGDPIYLPGWQVRVAPFFADVGDGSVCEYDFGDGWEHDVVLEQVSPRIRRTKYPQCLDGERACPPEDCGGPPGYAELLKRRRRDFGARFDPAKFSRLAVWFTDPRRRWKRVFGEG